MRDDDAQELEPVLFAQFGECDLGCWIDGSKGLSGALLRLADLLDLAGLGLEIAGRLRSSDSDKAALNLIREGIHVLQSHTEDGFVWSYYNGQLLLLTQEDAELVSLDCVGDST